MKKTSGFNKVVIAAIIVVLILLVAVQLYNFFFVTIKTEYAVQSTIEDSFDVSGVIARTEMVLNDNESGYHDVVLEDGEKVAKGGTIASVYAQEQDVKAQEEIRHLQAEIDEYNAAISAKTSYSGDGSAYEQSIQNALSEYAGALACNDVFAAGEAIESFEKSVFIKEIVSGQNDSYQQVLDDLRAQIQTLEASIGGSVNNITAKDAGFFSRTVDGYEDKVTGEILSEYSVEQFNQLFDELTKAEPLQEQVLGKLVSGYEWHLFFTAKASYMEEYKVGNSIKVKFPSVSDEAINGEIVSLKRENDTIVVGISFSDVQSRFLSSRTIEATIITKTISGIRIDKNSIRIVDGENGVYVKVGSMVKFKKIEILHMDTSFALIDGESSGVENFDQVITGGRNLYDGKVLS